MHHLVILALVGTLLPATLHVQHRIGTRMNNTMEVAVWDTYVTKKDGTVMHFDIIAPSEQRDTTVIHGYGRAYLMTKGQGGQPLTAKECRFCHVRALKPQWEERIRSKGYFILEMEGCE